MTSLILPRSQFWCHQAVQHYRMNISCSSHFKERVESSFKYSCPSLAQLYTFCLSSFIHKCSQECVVFVSVAVTSYILFFLASFYTYCYQIRAFQSVHLYQLHHPTVDWMCSKGTRKILSGRLSGRCLAEDWCFHVTIFSALCKLMDRFIRRHKIKYFFFFFLSLL